MSYLNESETQLNEKFNQKLEEAARLLASYADKHVDPDLGMSNTVLNGLGKDVTELIVDKMSSINRSFWMDSDRGRVRFMGVYSVDELNNDKPSWAGRPFSSFILNLGRDEDRAPTGHFVACLRGPTQFNYINPLGLSPPQDNTPLREIIKFFQFHPNNPKPLNLMYNCIQIQDLTSKACGFFALCFTLIHELRRKEDAIEWYVHASDLKKNDDHAVNIIQEILNECLDTLS